MDHIFTFQGGRLFQPVTELTLVNNTELVTNFTVPVHKRWQLLNVKVINSDDVVRDIEVFVYNEAALTNLLRMLVAVGAVAANGGRIQWPSSITTDPAITAFYAPVILENPNTISVNIHAGGASTGAVDPDGLIIEYLELDI